MKRAHYIIQIVFLVGLLVVGILDIIDKLTTHGSILIPVLAVSAAGSIMELSQKESVRTFLRVAQALLYALAIAGTVFIFVPVLSDRADNVLMVATATLYIAVMVLQIVAGRKRKKNAAAQEQE